MFTQLSQALSGEINLKDFQIVFLPNQTKYETPDMSNTVMEKRKYKRIQYAHSVYVKTQTGRNLRLKILDYSIGGMSLTSRTAFVQGDILEFEYLTTHNGSKRVLDLKGEVVHSVDGFWEYTYGVCFL